MNLVEIWVNDEPLDMYNDTDIRFTFQVNDIADVKDRQTNYTNSFNIPKTPNNVRIFKGLGIASDTSDIPYQKPNCRLKIQGYDLIVKGWLNVSETSEDYKCFVYSGIINFFKAIENKTLGDANLEKIQHDKNINNVINSVNNKYYRYLLADYNGLSHYYHNEYIINIDPIIPSASVKYLWDTIHKDNLLKTDFSYSGEIFNTEDFTNLWLTYSKSVGLQDDNTIKEHSIQFGRALNDWDRHIRIGFNNPVEPNNSHYTIEGQKRNHFAGGQYIDYSESYIKFKKNGTYKIVLDISSFRRYPFPAKNFTISLCIAEGDKSNEELLRLNKEAEFNFSSKDDEISEIFEFVFKTEQNKQCVFIILTQNDLPNRHNSGDYRGAVGTLKLIDFPNANPNYSEDFKQLLIVDFVKEIINRFGLTIFLDEKSNEITYMTLQERINAPVIDWTDKYIERISEKYIYNSYAQRNTFKLQYNDKEADYNDGEILINNKNLNTNKDCFNSKFYSPEKFLSENFYISGNKREDVLLIKFFEKEIKEDVKTQEKTIKYNPLEKRFYLIRERQISADVKFGSNTLKKHNLANKIAIADFSNLTWKEIIDKYYIILQKIISNSRIHTIKLNLSLVDILTLDFKKVYYFQQEGQYYLLNKLSFDNKGAQGEFIRIIRNQ